MHSIATMKRLVSARVANNAVVSISSTFLLCFVIIPSTICKAADLPESAEDWEWVLDLIDGKSLTYPKGENWNEYYKEVLIQTGGMGLGIALIVGLAMTICIVVFHFKGKRRKETSERITRSNGKYGTNLEDTSCRSRRNLWVGLMACFAGYTISAGLAYQAIIESEKTFSKSLDGTHEFLTKLQLSLWDINGGLDCHQGSIGEYLFNVKGSVDGTLDDVVAWIRDLGNLTNPLESAKAELEDTDATLSKIEQTLISMNSTIAGINTTFSNPVYDDIDFDLEISTLETSHLESIQSGQVAAQSGIDAIEASKNDIAEALGENSTVKALEYQIDDIQGNELASAPLDLRTIVTDLVYAMIFVFSDTTTDINDIQIGALNDVEEIADTYFKPAAAAVAGVLFLPAFILFLAVLCVVAVSSPRPLYATMAFSSLFQGIYFFVGGILLLTAQVNDDICSSHETIIQNLWADPLAIPRGPGEIIISNPPISWGDGILDTLNCKGRQRKIHHPSINDHHQNNAFLDEPEAAVSKENNLVDMLGISEYFNISLYLLEPTTLLTSEKDSLLLHDVVTDAQEPLSGVTISNVSVRDEIGMDEVMDACTTKLEQMPPANFDRDNDSQALLFENEYLSDGSLGFQWFNVTTSDPLYVDSLQAVNDILQGMPTIFVTFPPFTYLQGIIPLDFTDGKELLNSTAYCAGSDFEDSDNDKTTNDGYEIYTNGGDDDALCTAVTDFETKTITINNLDDTNALFVSDLEATIVALSQINSNLTSLDEDQNAVTNSINTVNDSLALLHPLLDTLYTEVDDIVASIENINVEAMAANEYTRCGFIGNIYHDVVLSAICDDVHRNLRSAAAPILTVGCLMFATFLLIGCYGYTIRRRNVSPEQDTHTYYSGNEIYQKVDATMTPPASPQSPTATAFFISKQ